MASSTLPTPVSSGDKWVQISSVTPSGSSITFSSISGYRKLALQINKMTTNATGDIVIIKLNNDSSALYNLIYNTQGSAAPILSHQNTQIGEIANAESASQRRTALFFIDSADQSSIKPITGFIGNQSTGNVVNYIQGSHYLGTAAITSIVITTAGGAQTLGGSGASITLFGVLA